jgi:hypothetical protein
MPMTAIEIWICKDESWGTTDIRGFKVEARDGEVGKIDEATYEAGSSYVVVDTGPWIFGTKVMIPGGAITRIDAESETVHTELTKNEIKDAPEFDEDAYKTDGYRSKLGDYYEQQKARAFRSHV